MSLSIFLLQESTSGENNDSSNRRQGFGGGFLAAAEKKFWNNAELNNNEEQIVRQLNARSNKCRPLSISIDERKGTFLGSDRSTYETTLDNCTCKDFSFRKLPCKHMYRLAHELGFFRLDKISSKGWGGWPVTLHRESAQQDRLHRGAYEEMTLGSFSEDGKYLRINHYRVSLSHCTCPDFEERKKPCKHIYRMAMIKGLIKKIPSSS